MHRENKSESQPPTYEDATKMNDTVESHRPTESNIGSCGMVVVVTDPVSHADDVQLISDGHQLEANHSSSVDYVGESGGWAGQSFEDKKIRQSFIRKVFLILMCQLLLTFGVISFFIFCLPIKNWVVSNIWFYYCAYGIFLVTYITLVCCQNVRRHWPGNFICLGIFTLAFSYMAGTLSCCHDTKIVLIAFGITSAVCLSISLFAIQTKIDFTMFSGLLFALCMVVFWFGISCIICGAVYSFESGFILTNVYAGLVALLFSLFLIYDIQTVMGGGMVQLHPEEYVFGALQIYLDVVYLFLIILSCAGRK